MTSNIHWMIAAAGADAQQTRQAGFSCVHFCSRLSEEGTFSLTALPAGSRGDYLGIADSRGIPKHCAAFAREAALRRAKPALCGNFGGFCSGRCCKS